MNEIQQFIIFSQQTWPQLRNTANTKVNPHCQFCINSSRYICLNESGLCHDCQLY